MTNRKSSITHWLILALPALLIFAMACSDVDNPSSSAATTPILVKAQEWHDAFDRVMVAWGNCAGMEDETRQLAAFNIIQQVSVEMDSRGDPSTFSIADLESMIGTFDRATSELTGLCPPLGPSR